MTRDPDTVEFADGAMTFDDWLAAINRHVEKFTGGMSREDFADWHYADAFEDAVEPRQAAIDMLAADSVGAQYLALAGIDADF